MPTVKFQSEKQHERFMHLNADVLYRTRVVEEVANPLVQARDQARTRLHSALSELGVPEGVQVIVQKDGLAYGAEGEVWDREKQAFVLPAEEAPTDDS
jgi:hypothetical protein